MIAATIRYVLPENTDWNATRSLMQERAALYLEMPGLISKAFVFDPKTREYGGNYVWENREALERFLDSEIFKGAVKRFGEPEIRTHEMAVYLDRGTLYGPEVDL